MSTAQMGTDTKSQIFTAITHSLKGGLLARSCSGYVVDCIGIKSDPHFVYANSQQNDQRGFGISLQPDSSGVGQAKLAF